MAQVPGGEEMQPGRDLRFPRQAKAGGGGTRWPSIAHQVSSGVLPHGKALSGPTQQLREAHQSLEFFINTLSVERLLTTRENLFGVAMEFLVCSPGSGRCVLLFCPYWKIFQGPGVRAQCSRGLWPGPLAGASQAVVRCQWAGYRTEALSSWRLPGLSTASRSGLGVFCAVTWVTQGGIWMFYWGEKHPQSPAPGRRVPLISRADRPAVGPPSRPPPGKARQAAVAS